VINPSIPFDKLRCEAASAAGFQTDFQAFIASVSSPYVYDYQGNGNTRFGDEKSARTQYKRELILLLTVPSLVQVFHTALASVMVAGLCPVKIKLLANSCLASCKSAVDRYRILIVQAIVSVKLYQDS